MADGKFKLSGSESVAVSPLGNMTQGIGYPLVPVEDDTAVVSRIFPVVLSKSATLRAGRYLRIGEVDTEDTPYVTHADAELVRLVIARSDDNQATMELVVDGEVKGQFYTESKKQSYPANIVIASGSSLSVRNATGSRMMRNVVVALIFKIIEG